MDVPPPYPAGGNLRSRLSPVVFAAPVAGLLRARVRGKLDAAAAQELHRRLQDELVSRQPRRLVIDLAGVRFLGLHGIAVLERLRRQGVHRRHDIALGAVSPAAEQTLRLAGILCRFERESPRRAGRPL
jgi:anti-anti-sigma factor